MGERERKIIWAAGFIDGEGCITVNQNRQKYNFSLILDVAQVKPEPLRVLSELFGGSVRAVRDKYGYHYDWRLYAAKAKAALTELLPYLVAKRAQAELGIEFYGTRSAEVAVALKALNTRRTLRDAERLSEETPRDISGDAIVRPYAN